MLPNKGIDAFLVLLKIFNNKCSTLPNIRD